MAKKKKANTSPKIIEISVIRPEGNTKVKWTDSEIQILSDMWEADCDIKDIASVLKTRSITAITNKIGSLVGEGILARKVAVPMIDMARYEEIMKLKRGL